MRISLTIIGLCILTAFVVGCGEHLQQRASVGDFAPVTLSSSEGDTILLQAEIAREPEDHARGLMFRKALPAGYGMLFVFEQPRILYFWMRNTLIPLDVLFFDADGRFVSSETMVPCIHDPCPYYASEAPAFYALEVAAGFVEEKGVSEAWTLDF